MPNKIVLDYIYTIPPLGEETHSLKKRGEGSSPKGTSQI